jgi:hypothetical protein
VKFCVKQKGGCFRPFFYYNEMRMFEDIKGIVLTITLSIFILWFSSCKKNNELLNQAAINFSEDTLSFDTVFTTIGSTTKYFTVFNRNSKDVKIDRIYLAGGNNSPFRLNIDGVSSNSVSDIIIPANDSIFVFVEVTVDPTNENSPMVISDSVMFVAANTSKNIKLLAWGQDVHLFRDSVLSSDAVWTNDKPYLIYGYLFVDTGVTLTINEGCDIHLHHSSSIYVAGKMLVNGTLDTPVVFQGDRLEQWYDDVPGQWDRIAFFQTSKGNIINYATIKNSIIGIQAGERPDYNDYAEVELDNVKIFNTNYAAIFSMGGHITAKNLVAANSGFYEAAFLIGGQYKFYHCTFNNYWSYSHRSEPSILISNNLIADGVLYVGNIEQSFFGNCIVHGDREDEIMFSEEEGGSISFKFNNCLVTSTTYSTSDTSYFNSGCLFNSDPRFADPENYDYHLKSGSVAINKGDMGIAVFAPFDYDGNDRTMDAAPDLGAFEYVQ